MSLLQLFVGLHVVSTCIYSVEKEVKKFEVHVYYYNYNTNFQLS